MGAHHSNGHENTLQVLVPADHDSSRPAAGSGHADDSLNSPALAAAYCSSKQASCHWHRVIIWISKFAAHSQTLDMFSTLCRDRAYPSLRLDGTTSITKRQKLVQAFCDTAQDQFVFLLSSKVLSQLMQLSATPSIL